VPRAIPAPLGPPAGFPDCPRCTYLRSGPPSLCLDCASAEFEGIALGACPICTQILDHGSCPNWLCADPGRRISKISAIAYSSGEVRRMILRHKYHGKSGWALIFGRLLVGWLETHGAADGPDLIVVNPTYLAPGVAGPGHPGQVLRCPGGRARSPGPTGEPGRGLLDREHGRRALPQRHPAH